MTNMLRDGLLMLVMGTALCAAWPRDVAAGPQPTKDTPKPFQLQPPLQRDGVDLLQAMRLLSEMQQKAADGDSTALSRQAPLAQEISARLARVDAGAWKSQELRRGLTKYVLSGGDPTPLQRLVKGKVIPEAELPLTLGAIAYALGDPLEAAEHLAKVEPRALAASLGGHVALVRALLASEGDKNAALALCDEARLLSPGTIIEETALRLSIELAIAAGDSGRFKRTAAGYLSRFPNSLYSGDLPSRIASVAVMADDAASPRGLRWLADLGGTLRPERRRRFFGAMAEAALRAGRWPVAEHAAGLALARDRQTTGRSARLLAVEAAAILFGQRRSEANQRLADAEAAGSDPETAELIATVRHLVSKISAPPAPTASALTASENDEAADKDMRPADRKGADTAGAAAKAAHAKAMKARTESALATADALVVQADK